MKQAPQAASSGPIAARAFDGDVANLDWGDRVESITRVDPDDGTMRAPINEVYSGTRAPGAKDIVISFFKREPVLIGSVSTEGQPHEFGVKDVESWTSPSSKEAAWVKAVEGAMPLEPNAFKRPVQAFTFAPVEARFVKVRLLRNHHADPARQGEIRLVMKNGQLVLE